jgi:uncharacterized phiE125 gp8 family phage protein
MILTHFLAFMQTAAPPVPGTLPVTLAQAKAHLRVLDTADDAYIQALIFAAADKIERDCRAVVGGARAVVHVQDSFAGDIRLPRRPVNSVAVVQYRSAVDGEFVDMDAADWRAVEDSAGMVRIVPAFGKVWPTIAPGPGGVRVTYQAGYVLAGDIPATLRHAALLLIGHWFEHREAVTTGAAMEVPLAYVSLVRPHRVEVIA